MNRSDLVLSVEEASQVLGISLGLAYQLAREGKLPCLRFGRRILIIKREFYKMLGVKSDDESKAGKNMDRTPD